MTHEDLQIPLALGMTLTQWLQVVSIFVSAFLAMVVGIVLDQLRVVRERRKAAREKLEREVRQINAVIAGIGFNVEALLHIVMQNVLPHHKDSHAAYNGLLATQADGERIAQFTAALHGYPALMMTCPDPHFIECDFWRDLPFVIEKDPELLKQSGWLTSFAREIRDTTAQRNKNIEAAQSIVHHQGGALNFYVLRSVLQMHAAISNTECVTAFQFFKLLVDMAKRLEKLNESYKIQSKKSKLITPPALEDAMSELKRIFGSIVASAP